MSGAKRFVAVFQTIKLALPRIYGALPHTIFTLLISLVSQAESIECKNEMDPFPHLIDLSQNKCIYIETFTLFKTADKFVFKL